MSCPRNLNRGWTRSLAIRAGLRERCLRAKQHPHGQQCAEDKKGTPCTHHLSPPEGSNRNCRDLLHRPPPREASVGPPFSEPVAIAGRLDRFRLPRQARERAGNTARTSTARPASVDACRPRTSVNPGPQRFTSLETDLNAAESSTSSTRCQSRPITKNRAPPDPVAAGTEPPARTPRATRHPSTFPPRTRQGRAASIAASVSSRQGHQRQTLPRVSAREPGPLGFFLPPAPAPSRRRRRSATRAGPGARAPTGRRDGRGRPRGAARDDRDGRLPAAAASRSGARPPPRR